MVIGASPSLHWRFDASHRFAAIGEGVAFPPRRERSRRSAGQDGCFRRPGHQVCRGPSRHSTDSTSCGTVPGRLDFGRGELPRRSTSSIARRFHVETRNRFRGGRRVCVLARSDEEQQHPELQRRYRTTVEGSRRTRTNLRRVPSYGETAATPARRSMTQ